MQHSIRWMVVILVVASLQLSACTQAPATKTKVAPVHLEPIEGTDLKRVVLTEKAAERLDIQTVPVRNEQVVRKRTVGGEVVALPEADAASPGAVWVRVHLNESDLSKVDQGQLALVRPLDDEEEEEEDDDGWEAEADEPPEGVDDAEDSETGEGALYYMVGSAGQGLVPGQRVWVELTLSGSGRRRIVVPYTAVIYDVHGETWVYANPEPLVFVRQPIVVDYIEDDLAVLSVGPSSSTEVVTVGGAELYGAETGVSK